MLEIALAAASVQDDLVTTELFADVRNLSGGTQDDLKSKRIDIRQPSITRGDLKMCPR